MLRPMKTTNPKFRQPTIGEQVANRLATVSDDTQMLARVRRGDLSLGELHGVTRKLGVRLRCRPCSA